jgi:long-chain acyl-CoA synthetase
MAVEAPRQIRTIPRLWLDGATQERDRAAYLVEDGDDWRSVSWDEAGRRIEELANGLLALGVRKGDAFAILGSTSLEWCLFDFALAFVGAVGVGVYMNSSPKDARYVVEHSASVGALVENEEQRAKLAGVRLEHVLSYDDLVSLSERGRDYAAENPGALDEALAAIEEGDPFTLIYTSGTTGPAKGCIITHRNYHAMVTVVDRLPEFTRPGDTVLLYLPLAHNFGRLMHLGGPYIGYTLALLGDPLRAAAALPHVRPTVFPSVPRAYEKIHTAVLQRIEEAHGAKRQLGEWALRVGSETSRRQLAGQRVPFALALRQRLADRMLFAKVRAQLGGRIRIGFSGGAPLAREVVEFFHSAGILVLEGYGLTECTAAVTVNHPDAFRFGTVGPALPGFELRLAEDGELLIRSETIFAGYYKDPDATREVMDEDGWLHSGDVATIDADGFVTIVDRKKDILITAGGKNVAPQNLENLLKLSPVVSEAVVVGDRKPYLTALITVDPACGLQPGTDEANAAVQEAVDAINSELSRYEQIKRFRILERNFSAEYGELTPTLKVKRAVVGRNFATEIAELYA